MGKSDSIRADFNPAQFEDNELQYLASADPLIERARRITPETPSAEDVYFLARSALAFMVHGETARAKNTLGLALASLERVIQRG